jgi:hypothetical protein
LDFKVLFIHPLENGLKSYILFEDNIYFITFLTNKKSAEFTVYSENKSDKLLQDTEIRQDLLNRFVLFLKQHKDEIKVGVYFDQSDEMYKKIFKLNSFNKKTNSLVDVSFSILEDHYTITNLRVIKTKEDIILDTAEASFDHDNINCFCENIKHNHDISYFEHCLVLIEHQEIILNWVKKEYKSEFIPNKPAKIIQFKQKKS